MRKGSRCTDAARRPAFTLAELVVSIGILVVLLGLASQVMSLTVKSTGQARALTEVSQTLRILEQTLREDLAGVHRPGPGVDEASVLLIQGNPINAYWTRDGRDADNNPDPLDGYPHVADPVRADPNAPENLTRPRADLLMIFTHRESESFVRYAYPNSVGLRSTPPMKGWKQVVYGHADLSEYIPNPSSAPGSPAYIFNPALNTDAFPEFPGVSPVAAEDWHLARRVVHLTHDYQTAQPVWFRVDEPPVEFGFDDPAVLAGTTDIIGGFNYREFVATPKDVPPGGAPWYWPPIFFGPNPPEPAVPFARSQLDPTPPPLYADRLGHYFLPNCASFKVEWALDPHSNFVGGRLDGEKRLYWIDPGDQGVSLTNSDDDDPLREIKEALAEAIAAVDQSREERLDQLLGQDLGGTPTAPYSLEQRFGMASPQGWMAHPFQSNNPRPNLHVFTATREDPVSGELIPEDIFPVALRITVDLYDRERRLDKPVRHVMILPVGDR